MNLSIYKYKQDQGRYARGVTMLLMTILWYYGCWTLYYFLHWPWAQGKLVDALIPVVNLPINPALIISIVAFFAGELLMIKYLNRPKFCNLLIETETEMKKVTWPSWGDSFNSSIVVLIGVIFFMIYLGCADILLNIIFSKIIFGGLA